MNALTLVVLNMAVKICFVMTELPVIRTGDETSGELIGISFSSTLLIIGSLSGRCRSRENMPSIASASAGDVPAHSDALTFLLTSAYASAFAPVYPFSLHPFGGRYFAISSDVS